MKRPDKLNQMVERSGIPREDFLKLVERLHGMRDAVPASITRIAARADANDVALLSHDDASPEQRQWFRARGCRVSEFPVNIETARDAADAGDQIVLGAPNVMRGKSHMGWVNAAEMVSLGLCSVLASDYYYPAPLIAAFRLVETGVAPLETAWRLVSGSPAKAAGLEDRGEIATGKRVDSHIGRERSTGASTDRRRDRQRPDRASDRAGTAQALTSGRVSADTALQERLPISRIRNCFESQSMHATVTRMTIRMKLASSQLMGADPVRQLEADAAGADDAENRRRAHVRFEDVERAREEHRQDLWQNAEAQRLDAVGAGRPARLPTASCRCSRSIPKTAWPACRCRR